MIGDTSDASVWVKTRFLKMENKVRSKVLYRILFCCVSYRFPFDANIEIQKRYTKQLSTV